MLRAVLILAGAWLLATVHWILYVFGAFLVLTGIKMWLVAGKEPDIGKNPVLKFLRSHMNITTVFDGEKLSTMINGVKHYTPMFVVLVLIGTKMLLIDVYKMPIGIALSVTAVIIAVSMFASLYSTRKPKAAAVGGVPPA